MTMRPAFPLAMQVMGESGRHDVPRLAAQGLAVEIADFFDVAMWQGDYQGEAYAWATALKGFPYGKCLHGAFIDLAPGAQEPQVVEFARTRHRQSLEVAAIIGCDMMIVHSAFPLRDPMPWQMADLSKRLVDYFGALAVEAQHHGVTIVVENIQDTRPEPLVALAAAINAPNLGLSLDVGHAHLYSPLALDAWVWGMQPYLKHCHLHDNDGTHDRHWKPGEGNMTYRAFFEAVNAVPVPPRVTVEVPHLSGAWDTVRMLVAQGWYAPPEHAVIATEEIGVHKGID